MTRGNSRGIRGEAARRRNKRLPPQIITPIELMKRTHIVILNYYLSLPKYINHPWFSWNGNFAVVFVSLLLSSSLFFSLLLLFPSDEIFLDGRPLFYHWEERTTKNSVRDRKHGNSRNALIVRSSSERTIQKEEKGEEEEEEEEEEEKGEAILRRSAPVIEKTLSNAWRRPTIAGPHRHTERESERVRERGTT